MVMQVNLNQLPSWRTHLCLESANTLGDFTPSSRGAQLPRHWSLLEPVCELPQLTANQYPLQ